MLQGCIKITLGGRIINKAKYLKMKGKLLVRHSSYRKRSNKIIIIKKKKVRM